MSTAILLVILILVVVITLAIFAWVILNKLGELTKKGEDQTLLEWAKTTQTDIKELQKTMSDAILQSNRSMSTTLQQNTKDIHDRLTRAAEVIGELKREAGAFSEVSRSMKDLQDFLKSPKLRGNLGEHVLNDLIKQVFPKQQFLIQHKFKSGNTVDAAIKTDAGILPIDSKFPMENFQRMMKLETEKERDGARREFIRDVKKHIETIASKYILPEEGTMDFAMMYVPSETVYYEIANSSELQEYARTQRVYVVSPTTLYAFLQTILLSFEGKRIEAKSREVMRMLRGIGQDYKKVVVGVNVLGRHVTNAYNSVSVVTGSVNQLGQKLDSTMALGNGEEADPQKLEA